MSCPQCHNNEISSSGICLFCGFQVEAIEPDPPIGESENVDRPFAGIIEIDYAGGPEEAEAKAEMPEWRRELSERLKAIRQKREQMAVTAKPQAEAVASVSAAPQPRTDHVPDRPAETIRKRAPARVQGNPPGPLPQQKVLQPLQMPAPKAPDPGEVQKIIDNATSRHSLSPPAEIPVEISFSAAPKDAEEGKLILLSRILSGLVDLIFIVLCTGAFIIAADRFSGILVVDSISLLDFAGLFLLIYFFYSLFFLAASNQTLGMMITDLRVVGSDARRPLIRQLVGRCFGYLVSLIGLGIGLLWSLFDRESLCFHDHVSHTHIIRI
jgi:uncharacterized RDD family membrane protein YckC